MLLLYHGTRSSYVENILKEGLDPSSSHFRINPLRRVYHLVGKLPLGPERTGLLRSRIRQRLYLSRE